MMNPRVTFGICFVDYFWIKRGCVLSQIQASHTEGVSLIFPESALTPFSFTFLSHQGLRALPNPHVTFGSCFGDDLWGCSDSVFVDISESQGLWALTNPHVTFGSCFVNFFLVNRGCGAYKSTRYLLEGVSVMISQSASTMFSLTFFEATGASSSSKSTYHVWKLCFVDFFCVNMGCELFKIHASPLEGVLVMISQATPTLFSLNFSESRGAADASESTRHLSKVFRWWFLRRQGPSFRWLFLCQQKM